MSIGYISITKETNRESLDVCGPIWTLSWRMIVLRIKILDIPAEGRRLKGAGGCSGNDESLVVVQAQQGRERREVGGSGDGNKWPGTFQGPREFSWNSEGAAEPRGRRAISTTLRTRKFSCTGVGGRGYIKTSASNEEVSELVCVSEKEKLNQPCRSRNKGREDRHLGKESEKSIFDNWVIWASWYLCLPD